MQIEEGKFKRLVGRVEEQQQKMVAHPMHADERRDVKYGQYATKVDIGEKLKHVDKEIRDAQVRLFTWFIWICLIYLKALVRTSKGGAKG